jgi:tetratricopeptide (TPR) repeat protein
MWLEKHAPLLSRRPQIATALRSGRIVALVAACLAASCDSAGDEARREYFKALDLSKTGQPLEEQLAHVDRAVRLVPTSATYLGKRANLLFAVNRLAEARVDYDRAVELADRPYLRFERADLLCALGEYDAALADLDRAIGAQPENTQFYPRRALARLAMGRVAEARADVDRAMASFRAGASERYARSAVLLMEGKFAEALADLDVAVAHASDPSHGALPRTLRLLAHTALDQREHAAAQFDRQTLKAAAYWPELGYRYWLVPRGCDNAFIAAQAGELVAKAESILVTRESRPDSSGPSQTGAGASNKPARAAPPGPADRIR